MRVRERTNTWPSFVDLFSNLVIILIFLLIVFVFLWTTTNVFNKKTAITAEKVAELRKVAAEQTEQITTLKENEEQARSLLLLARDELLSLDENRATLEADKNALAAEKERMLQDQMEIVAAYEKKLYGLQSERESLEKSIQDLRAQNLDKQVLIERAAGLKLEMERINNALAVSEQARAAKEVEYAAMAERLNMALADKVSELNQLSKYQSQFFGEVQSALTGVNGVDVSTDRFVISSDILFPSGGFHLSPEGKRQIGLVANIIKGLDGKIPSNVNWVIRVDGHTDRIPVNKNAKLYKNNLELSLLRAKEVVGELEKNGVMGRRLIPAGFGADYPLVEGKTAKDLQKNRRIELRLTNP